MEDHRYSFVTAKLTLLAGRGGWNGGPGTGRPAHPPAVGGPVSAVGHTPAPNTAVVRGTGAGHTTHTELQQGTTYMTSIVEFPAKADTNKQRLFKGDIFKLTFLIV